MVIRMPSLEFSNNPRSAPRSRAAPARSASVQGQRGAALWLSSQCRPGAGARWSSPPTPSQNSTPYKPLRCPQRIKPPTSEGTSTAAGSRRPRNNPAGGFAAPDRHQARVRLNRQDTGRRQQEQHRCVERHRNIRQHAIKWLHIIDVADQCQKRDQQRQQRETLRDY